MHLCFLSFPSQLSRDGIKVPMHREHLTLCDLPSLADSVIKSCSYKSFCDQARRGGSGGATLQCCFSDDCNGPRGSRNGGGATPLHLPSLLAVALAGKLLLGLP